MAHYTGELAAIGAALCWTGTSLVFEAATRRAGNLAVNVLRMTYAIVLITVLAWLWRGMPFPTDAGTEQTLWLILSGIVGFILGDLFLFQAFERVGARISMLVMSLVPPLTAACSWPLLGEPLNAPQIIGILVTVTGIILVVLKNDKQQKKIRFRYSLAGILLALGGAVGQSAGLMLSKFGMGDYDFISATQIRIAAGMAGFWIICLFGNKTLPVLRTFRDAKSTRLIFTGAFFGPFVGVSLSLLAVQNTLTGIASTLMAIVPVLIIPPAILLFKEKVTLREIVGASISVGGVAILFLF